RDAAKRWLAVIPRRLRRSVYVWIASLLLAAVCGLWRTVGGDVYRVDGLAALSLAAVQLAGFWIIARAVAKIDPLELAGIRATEPDAAGSAVAEPSALQVTGPYRLVRH